jgi:hypothetical protein
MIITNTCTIDTYQNFGLLAIDPISVCDDFQIKLPHGKRSKEFSRANRIRISRLAYEWARK